MKPYYKGKGVTLYHGDWRDVDQPADLAVMVTDPPYGKKWKRGGNPAQWSKAQPGIANDHSTTERDDALKRWGDRAAVVFGSLYAPFPAGMKQVLIWHKPINAGVVGCTTGFRRDVEAVFLVGPVPRRTARWSSVLVSEIRNVGGWQSPAGMFKHPHAKPEDLMRQLIDIAPGVVFDPFAGAGSTLVAACQLGRPAVGVELVEAHCEMAARRLEAAEFTVER